MGQTEIRPDRVAVYIRWSTDDQGDGTTLEVQREGCRHYSLSQGWQFNEQLVFIDDGYSGGSVDRPALNKLRAAILQGLVDCVVVFKIDRLSRNVVDTVNLVLREWEGRCHVKSAREAIDTTTQQGKMFFYTLVSFAEWERSVIKERTWSGRMKRLQEGKNPGFKPPYGLRTGPTPGTFSVEATEAPVVRRIYELYNQGLGYKTIAVQLAREGILFRGAREFSARTVAEILANPIYVGKLVYGRIKRSQSQGRRPTRGTPQTIDSTYIPHLVDPEQWQLAQANRSQRSERRTPNRAVASEHLLTGLVRCKHCGYTLIGRKRYGRKGRKTAEPAYYICHGQRLRGTGFCSAGYLRQDLLDTWVVDRLLERYSGEAGKTQYLQDADRAIDGQVATVAAALLTTQKELDALQKELDVIGRDYRRERLSLEEYTEHKAAVARERSRLIREMAELETKLATLKERKSLQRSRLGTIDSVQRWGQLSHAERKHLLRELVHDLRVYRNPVTNQVEFDLTWISDDEELRRPAVGQD